MRISRSKIVLVLVALSIFSNAFAAENVETVGRYLTVVQNPLSSQRDLLSQTIQMRFPQSVQTVGDAVSHLLRYSGYSLLSENKRSSDLNNILQKPLPLVQRELGPMMLRDALITLIGSAFILSEDTLNREIDFHLKDSFSKKIHNGVS